MTPQTDYEKLLRDAVEKAREKTKQASEDLYRFSSEVAEAVDRVTGGLGEVKLVALSPSEPVVAYQLQLRRVGSESPPSDLGIYRPAAGGTGGGYPVQYWNDRRSWESEPRSGNQTFSDPTALESHFKDLASNPNSRLVILVAFLQQQTQAGPVGAGS